MKRFACYLAIVAVIAMPVACITQDEAKKHKEQVDKGVAATDEMLDAVGAGQFKPLAHAAGGVAKWIIGMCVSAGAGAAATQHAHGGLPFLGGRRGRKKQEDAEWDALLERAEGLAQIAHNYTEAAGGSPRVAERAAETLQLIGALKSKQPKPRRKKESPSPLVPST